MRIFRTHRADRGHDGSSRPPPPCAVLPTAKADQPRTVILQIQLPQIGSDFLVSGDGHQVNHSQRRRCFQEWASTWFAQRRGCSGQEVGGARTLGSGLYADPYWVSRTGLELCGSSVILSPVNCSVATHGKKNADPLERIGAQAICDSIQTLQQRVRTRARGVSSLTGLRPLAAPISQVSRQGQGGLAE